MLDSVPQIHARYGEWLYLAEWAFTVVFAIEYGLRLWSIQNRMTPRNVKFVRRCRSHGYFADVAQPVD